MPSYPLNIRRCQHIKVNGTQCASPALRDEKHCYYHMEWRRKSSEVNLNLKPRVDERGTMTLPSLEDANSIQVALAEIVRLLATNQIDHRPAGLMLYALQTASANLRMTSFEPEPTRVVIDQQCVEQRPIGATAWSTVEGCEYDDVAPREIAERVVAPEEEGEATFDSMLSALVARAAQNSGNSNQRRGPARAFEKK
jgi:hypothetical protein